MTLYDVIREQISKTVPFARHAGVELVRIDDGVGEAELRQTETSANHLGSQHAGALFTLGEAASGAAMAGALAPLLLEIRPVAADARISFSKIAKGTISAIGRTSKPGAELLRALEQDGRVAFDVDVVLTDEAGDRVSMMTVEWNVKASG